MLEKGLSITEVTDSFKTLIFFITWLTFSLRHEKEFVRLTWIVRGFRFLDLNLKWTVLLSFLPSSIYIFPSINLDIFHNLPTIFNVSGSLWFVSTEWFFNIFSCQIWQPMSIRTLIKPYKINFHSIFISFIITMT